MHILKEWEEKADRYRLLKTVRQKLFMKLVEKIGIGYSTYFLLFKLETHLVGENRIFLTFNRTNQSKDQHEYLLVRWHNHQRALDEKERSVL